MNDKFVISARGDTFIPVAGGGGAFRIRGGGRGSGGG